MDQVILVNEQDESIGSMEKLQAHQEGVLHRAFSVFVFNDRGELLLQQRAWTKYHSPGLWSNTCCSHPQPGEGTLAGAHRRLREELGFDCELNPLFHLRYRSDVGNALIENEYDHVFAGTYTGSIHPNPEEVAEIRFVPLERLQYWLHQKPEQFTTWFRLAMPELIRNWS